MGQLFSGHGDTNMPKQIDSSPKIRCAEVPRLRTGEDAFLRKAERKPPLSLKPKGSQMKKGLQKNLKGALRCATYDRLGKDARGGSLSSL